MRLLAHERRVLAAVQFNVFDSLKQLRAASGCREHQIRYCVQKFIAAGVIKPRVVLDVSRLGFQEYSLALTVAHENSESREKLKKFFIAHSRTVDVVVIGGNYDYLIALASKDSQQILEFLSDASRIRGIRVIGKQLSQRVRSTLYRRTFLARTKKQENALSCGGGVERPYELDETDLRIVEAMLPMNFQSFRSLARTLSMPHSSVLSRVEKMRAARVIVGYAYGFHSQQLGLHVFRLLLFTTGLLAEQVESLRAFCERHNRIVTLIETLGTWDFEVLIEVSEAEESRTIAQEFYELLGLSIVKVELLPVFRYLKAHFGDGFNFLESDGACDSFQ